MKPTRNLYGIHNDFAGVRWSDILQIYSQNEANMKPTRNLYGIHNDFAGVGGSDI